MIRFLYGAPASGKTTLGKLLAERLGITCVDLDEVVEHKVSMPIREIFVRDGETKFRDLETVALRETVEKSSDDTLISLGGGTLLNDENRAFVESVGTVSVLEVAESILESRIRASAGERPLGLPQNRKAHYASFNSKIFSSIELPNSLVIVGTDVFDFVKLAFGERKVLAVCDENTRRYAVNLNVPLCVLPSGEKYKNLESVSKIWQSALNIGLKRGDMMVAVGGGVVGDLTGFAAATYMRGIEWINLPTTLLAMVDASTGGKTGCDLPEGKNLIGAFHSPKLVVADTTVLETLPFDEIRNGRAEWLKHELISGRKLESVAEALLVKAEIVREDPFERNGLRWKLNCGHTVAHALEVILDFSISHGEAVAIGCCEEAKLAERLGFAKKGWAYDVSERFAKVGLRTELPQGVTFESLIPLMRHDKKNSGATVAFSLPIDFGRVELHRLKL